MNMSSTWHAGTSARMLWETEHIGMCACPHTPVTVIHPVQQCTQLASALCSDSIVVQVYRECAFLAGGEVGRIHPGVVRAPNFHPVLAQWPPAHSIRAWYDRVSTTQHIQAALTVPTDAAFEEALRLEEDMHSGSVPTSPAAGPHATPAPSTSAGRDSAAGDEGGEAPDMRPRKRARVHVAQSAGGVSLGPPPGHRLSPPSQGATPPPSGAPPPAESTGRVQFRDTRGAGRGSTRPNAVATGRRRPGARGPGPSSGDGAMASSLRAEPRGRGPGERQTRAALRTAAATGVVAAAASTATAEAAAPVQGDAPAPEAVATAAAAVAAVIAALGQGEAAAPAAVATAAAAVAVADAAAPGAVGAAAPEADATAPAATDADAAAPVQGDAPAPEAVATASAAVAVEAAAPRQRAAAAADLEEVAAGAAAAAAWDAAAPGQGATAATDEAAAATQGQGAVAAVEEETGPTEPTLPRILMSVGRDGPLHAVTDDTLWSLGRRGAWPAELVAWAINYVITRRRGARPAARTAAQSSSHTRPNNFIVVPPEVYNEVEEVLSKRSVFIRTAPGRAQVKLSEDVVGSWVESAQPVSHRTVVAVVGLPSNQEHISVLVVFNAGAGPHWQAYHHLHSIAANVV